MDRLCVGGNSDSVLCRLQEVHSRQIIGNSNDKSVAYHQHRQLDMDDKHRIMNLIVESELKKTLMKELANYNHQESQDIDNNDIIETSKKSNELDTFYKNLTAAASTVVRTNPNGGGTVKIKRSGFKISPEGGRNRKLVISAAERDMAESESSAGFLTDKDFESSPTTKKKSEGDEEMNFSADRDSGFSNISLKTTHRSSETSKNSLSTTSVTPPPYTMIKQTQQCNIPVVDPFHREVQPYITYKWKGEKCTLRWRRSYVEEGVLHVVGLTDAVQRVTVNYIKRVDDEENELDAHVVYNSKTMPLKGTHVI